MPLYNDIIHVYCIALCYSAVVSVSVAICFRWLSVITCLYAETTTSGLWTTHQHMSHAVTRTSWIFINNTCYIVIIIMWHVAYLHSYTWHCDVITWQKMAYSSICKYIHIIIYWPSISTFLIDLIRRVYSVEWQYYFEDKVFLKSNDFT